VVVDSYRERQRSGEAEHCFCSVRLCLCLSKCFSTQNLKNCSSELVATC